MLARIRRAWPNLASAAENTLLLTHAGPIACLLHLVNGARLEDALAAGVPYGAVLRLGREAR